MVVDFAKVNVKEQPLLILQNMDDTPIGVLKWKQIFAITRCQRYRLSFLVMWTANKLQTTKKWLE